MFTRKARPIVAMLLALAAAVPMVLLPGAPAGATADTGIHPSCEDPDLGDLDKPTGCSEENGPCFLRAWNPTVATTGGNDTLKVKGSMACSTNQDRIKVGPSALYRYDCTRFALQWSCTPASKTNVGDFHQAFCGYQPTHDDHANCEIDPGPPVGYDSLSMTWTYDVKDDAASCHAFQQELNGVRVPADGVVHIFHEADSWGTLYGKGAYAAGRFWQCSGTIGNFVG